MKRIKKILDYFVFLATTVAIAAVFYEGMALYQCVITFIDHCGSDYACL